MGKKNQKLKEKRRLQEKQLQTALKILKIKSRNRSDQPH